MISPFTLAEMIHGVTRHIPRPDGSRSPEWYNLSVADKMRSVDAIHQIMRSEPLTAKRGHELWMELKVRDGWTYAPWYSESDKFHPCIMPFCDLPVSERLKDETWVLLTELFRPHIKL